ncbi:uncharacterized protein LOC133192469 [Saccostrea echinata]|uniref:uncharacterized protein LOC133192469 n=1 Tax=Saccostrea echinata TaxID=191078 RepID=UPI002A7EC804|nr:uncharacterized protein LOC133192469 [Saccostrea echinata]
MPEFSLLVHVVFHLGNFLIIAESLCTLPDELEGVWYSAQKGPLTINSTHIQGYPIYMSVSVRSLDFECIEQSDRKYMFKSTETVIIFGGPVHGFICLEFWRISATKYYYFHKTAISGTNNDHNIGKFNGITATLEETCSESYSSTSFVTLVKDGSIENGSSEATCATDLLDKFSLVTISEYNDASSCVNNTMDGCSDKTKLSFTYHSSCTANHKFSAGGFWTCLRSITSNRYTYVSLWNNDTTVTSTYTYSYNFDSGRTYKFACLVVKGTSATLFPKICSDSTQTPTSVGTHGLKLTFSGPDSTCHTKAEDESDIVYYVIIILGSLFIISLIILLIILRKKGRKCKRTITKSNVIGSHDITMSKPPEKIKPLYLNEPPLRREKTDVISILEFNTNEPPPREKTDVEPPTREKTDVTSIVEFNTDEGSDAL